MKSHKRATKAGDWNAVARIEKNMKDAVKELAGDKDTLPFDQIQPPKVKIGFFPQLTGVTLPDDLDAQVQQLIKPKRKTEHFPDAEVVNDNGN
ncbi:hypothetical protein GCM10027199_86570 [Amycolatopsis magusensis]